MKENIAAANAGLNTNTDNNKSEGTIVLSKSDKEARAERVKELFSKIIKDKKATLKEKLELAIYLLETKRALKNEFYTFITNDVMIGKQVRRHIQLILTLESIENFTQGMSTKNKKVKDIEKNLALLVEDTRVTSLTIEQIDKMPEPTMAAIIRAKPAETNEEFRKILERDKDTLDAIRDRKSATTQETKDNKAKAIKIELDKLKPENMDTKKYESLLSEDKTTIISMLQEQIDDSKVLSDELADLKKLAKDAKFYGKDQSKSEAEAKKEEG